MRVLSILAAVLLLVAVPSFGQKKKKQQQEKKPPSAATSYEVVGTSKGRAALSLPARTDNGEWAGTWIYVNRDYNFALWLTENEGKPIAKVRFTGNGNLNESFETDWEGRADYSMQGYPARFELHLDEAGPDTMRGTWNWDLDFRGSARREDGVIEMYRSGDGRQLVMHFEEFRRVIESASGDRSYNAPQAWTFRKLSKRLVLWEELPF